MKEPPHECEQCGKLYFPIRPEQKFCSRSCAKTREHMLRNVDASLIDELMCAIRADVEKILKK